MRRSQQLALIAVAWVAPLAWLALALDLDASDGTIVTSPSAVLGAGRWGESVTVLDTRGDTPLRTGDQVLTMAGLTAAEWLTSGEKAEHSNGDSVAYEIRRPGATLDRIQQVDVSLRQYPLGAAVTDNLDRIVLAVGLLTAGSFLLVRRAREPLALATLGLGVATAVGLSGDPFGVQAIDLTESDGLPSHAIGDVMLSVGLAAVLLLAWSFPRPPVRLAEHRLLWLPLVAAPFVAYAGWVLAYALRQPEPARLQALHSISLPGLGITVVLVVLALATGYLRASAPEERIAVRLMVLAALAALLVRVVLDDVPRLLRGEPLVPWNVLALVLVPLVLACWVAAVLGYRLLEVDTTLRRSLLQVVLATLIGVVFLAAAGAVNVAAGTSVRSLVTGGAVALILLPVALVLRRTVSRLVYGDRAFPYRVVSELRRLDPRAGPEGALQETLALLSRSLRLSYASIEGVGSAAEDRFVISQGERRGDPTTVLLEVAGTPLGRLDMEVSPMRDPFGPRDRRLLEDVGTQVGALVQALVATRELQRARERLIAAREEERRRLRRDLHDGLGPSLATLLMKLEIAKDLIPRDPQRAADLVGQITDQTEADIVEIRRLVDGLRPPALDQLGLVSALRQRADEYNHAAALDRSGSSLTWSVVADEVGTLPAAVEVAAYRIAVEAVNNAVRHSRGSACVVTLRRDHDALEVEIRDDGAGVRDAPGTGVGVGSMRERAEELGGTCTVSPAAGGGTQVLAHLPLTTLPTDENRRS